MTLEDAERKIESALVNKGQFTHNILSIILRTVAKEHGIPKADSLVDKHGLKEKFNIEKLNQGGFL